MAFSPLLNRKKQLEQGSTPIVSPFKPTKMVAFPVAPKKKESSLRNWGLLNPHRVARLSALGGAAIPAAGAALGLRRLLRASESGDPDPGGIERNHGEAYLGELYIYIYYIYIYTHRLHHS